MIDPILIMATPRSGSSMTAGIFARHGVWTGKVRPGSGRNPKGFFENQSIRDIVMDHNGRIVKSGRVCDKVPGFRERVEPAMIGEGYKEGPWLWKGSAMYWPAWFEWPDPKWVVCRRDLHATVESLSRSPFALGTDAQQYEPIIKSHHAQIDLLIKEYGAYEVKTQAVALGDFATIKTAIEGCGLVFDEAITDEFVDKDQWHHVARS